MRLLTGVDVLLNRNRLMRTTFSNKSGQRIALQPTLRFAGLACTAAAFWHGALATAVSESAAVLEVPRAPGGSECDVTGESAPTGASASPAKCIASSQAASARHCVTGCALAAARATCAACALSTSAPYHSKLASKPADV